jgi:hypothetical protein
MNVVIDIETLSLRPNAIILSIGAVADSGETFYTELNWGAQLMAARHVDARTAIWWGKQTEQAPLLGEVFLWDCLEDLNQWLADYDKDKLYIWARGPQFDIVISGRCLPGMRPGIPWKYKNVRDVRTALHLSTVTDLFDPTRKHHALDDAIADMKNLALRGFTTYDLRT